MQIQDAWKKWRYLGYDRETCERFRMESAPVNLRTLKQMAILGLILSGAASVVSALATRDTARMAVSLCAFGFFILVLLHALYLIKQEQNEKQNDTNGLILLVSIVIYLIGIFVGTFLADGELAVLAVWLFLLVQISYELPPLQNALTVIPCAVLFILCSRLTKPAPKSIYDAVYCGVSVVVGLFMSHHQTRLAIDNVIAKKCLTQANFALYHTCTTDELTGLSNRRMVFEKFDEILQKCVSSGQSLACIVLDIDDYKQYNDTYGHPEGDALLQRIGEALHTYADECKIDIGRIGGEEFLAVWVENSTRSCERVAEELRSAIGEMNIPNEGALDHPNVTISAGLCILPPVLAHRAYFFADKALYRAKDTGKNRSCRYDVETGEYRLICCDTDKRTHTDETVRFGSGWTEPKGK